MKKITRDWFLQQFGNANGGINVDAAAQFCGVAPRTVRYWWSVSCPPWIDRFAELAARAIPETKEWQGFGFDDQGRLITPYKNHSFSPGELLFQYYDSQFNTAARVERERLNEQIEALRSEDEAAAIRDELATIAATLDKLKQSPILAPKGQRYQQPVGKERCRADKSGAYEPPPSAADTIAQARERRLKR